MSAVTGTSKALFDRALKEYGRLDITFNSAGHGGATGRLVDITPEDWDGGAGNPLHTCTQDRFGGIFCQSVEYVYRQLTYNSDPRVPAQTAQAQDPWFTEWIMVESPEESKYTAQLTLFPRDNQRNEELYVFLPSLRRSIRLSVAARCSPVLGTDYIQDDYKSVGFNGGIAMFDAKFLGRRKLLTLFGDYNALAGDFPNNYYMPLGWPKPSWGAWPLRDVDVIDARRVPSKRNGYCVSSRIIYEDAQTHYALWEESFDANLKLWKTSWVAQREVEIPISVSCLVPSSQPSGTSRTTT